MPAWYEDESFWNDTERVIFSGERMAQAPADVDGVLALASPPQGGTVLDLGCGVGRHSIEFARRGFDVTGADVSEYLLGRAREAADKQGASVEWHREDMRTFRRVGHFDLVVNLLTSFGILDDPSDDRRVLENVYASLRGGGRLVIDLMGKEILARIYRERDWHELPDGTILLEQREIEDNWRRLNIRWIVMNEGRQADRRFRLRLYSAAELAWLVESVGFVDVRCLGSLAGALYGPEAERLIVVARKPEDACT